MRSSAAGLLRPVRSCAAACCFVLRFCVSMRDMPRHARAEHQQRHPRQVGRDQDRQEAAGDGQRLRAREQFSMLASSLENVTRAPWLVLFPGLAILGATLAIFLIADGLRDAMDPRLRS